MSRTASLSALLAVAIVGALAIGAVTVGSADQASVDPGESAVVSATNTSNVLALEGETRTEYVRTTVDVAAAAAVSADSLHGTHQARTFQQRYQNASTSSSRVTVVRTAVDQTEETLDRLNQRQSDLYRAYRDGSIDGQTFVRRLARLQTEGAQARSMQEHIRTTVESDVGTTLPFSLDRRVTELEADIVTLPSPLTSASLASMTGQSEPQIVYVEGSDAGVVLARVTAGGYTRQATLRTAYTPNQSNQFEGSITDAYQRVLDLYPWVADNALNGPNLVEQGASVYRVNAEHTHGELTTFVHGGTGSVFHEIQRKQLGGVPLNGTVQNESRALNITVEQTTATGPMRVTVRDAESGPVPADITVNGQPVGTTGFDGRLWVVQPSGDFRVNATANGNSVVATGP